MHETIRWLLPTAAGIAGTRWFLALIGSSVTLTAAPEDFFAIQVVDAATGRGVPLVELRAVNEAAWWTDSNGFVAFNEPGLMNREVFLHVVSPGYEMPADGFGYRGVKLRPVAGGNTTVPLVRLNIAERLYRVTGAGVYRDSVLLGRQVPTEQPLLNGEVTGQDTVVALPYAVNARQPLSHFRPFRSDPPPHEQTRGLFRFGAQGSFG